MNPTRNASTPAARLALAPVAAAGAPAGTASALVFALGVLAVALGALVVLTWAVRLPASDVAGIVKVPMRVNAGIGFLVDGLALLLLPFRGTARTIVLPVVGLFNLAAALLALAAYFLGGDSPLAAWPLGPLRGAVLGAQAGALAPPSAVAFVLIGLAFTLVGGTRPRSAGVPVLLALGSTLVAMAALALGGHLARSAFGVDWWNVAGMGVPTAAGTLLIGGALIAWTRHAFAVRWSLDATTTSAFLLGIVAIVLIASASYDFTARLERDTAQVSRTEEVLKEIEEVTTAQRDLSLNLGRYLIARDASLLADRPRIEAAIAAGIGRIRALAGAEAEKLHMLDDLVALTAQRIAKSDDIIARARADDPSARIESLIGKDYQAVGSAIDRLLQAMRAAEYAALQQRIARADATSGKTFLLLPIGVFGSLAVLLLGLFFVNGGAAERRRVEQASRRLAAIVESSDDAIIGIDRDATITTWNRGAERMFGHAPADAVGKPLALLVPPDDVDAEAALLARIRQGDDVEPYEARRLTRQGATIDVSISASPILDDDGAIAGVSQIARDLGERRKAEQRIRYLNRVYATLSAINTLIVRARDHAGLYQGACDIAVREGGFRMAWIATITDEDDRLRLVASTGVEPAFLADIEDALSRNRGVRTGALRVEQAVRERQPVVSNDARNDPTLEFRARFDALGVGSIALLPLSASGESLGVLALYADEAEFFHADEQKLLMELAGDIGFAVEHIRHQARIDYLAAHDVLTDLPNRLTMRDRVTQAISHARRAGHQVALMYIDLDRFKVINDGHGHRYGDAVLRGVGARLRALLREEDSVGRESGDEFIVLLPGLRRFADAYVVAQNILDAFERPFAIEGEEAHLTASIGVSMFPQDGDTADLLIERADAAMYRGKELGRNTYQFFSRLIGEETQARVDVEAKLRGAIARGELAMVYQPKVSLASGRITGCEALLRWRHPDLGLVPPSHFIPIAEESGLIVPIGTWALRTACAQSRAWLDAGLPGGVVSVNLSARQFLQQDVVSWVLKTLDETGLPPELLELELTETLIAQDTGKVIGSIDRLRSAGVRHSIDDFGTGYSSLAYLSRFKVDTLKIDQSFIRNMHRDRHEAVIPLAVISLAHSLRLEVIAEGVETAEQCALLREHGCDAIQGYYFSPPVEAAEFAAMLRAGRALALPAA